MPLVFLRKLRVHEPRLTISDIIRYTLLSSIESLDVERWGAQDSDESFTGFSEAGEVSRSVLRKFQFIHSILPTELVFKLLLGYLTALRLLDWTFQISVILLY
jgi:hypothetical protein